jgi:mannose-1-phosphate guanylyltransferase
MTHTHRQPWALVLAGGDGTRLQELTRLISGAPIPKQYCRIQNRQSLLENTLASIAPLTSPSRTLVIINHSHLSIAREQLGTIPSANMLVQPHNRDTGPGMLFALLELARRDPDATVAVFPSDHYVGNPHAFRTHVGRALEAVRTCPERIGLLGIRPEWTEPGYGYIEPGPTLLLQPGGAVFGVTAFREKPGAESAAAIIARGGLWNSFVMVFRMVRVLDLIGEIRPDDFNAMQRLASRGRMRSDYIDLPRWNFSSDFLGHVPEHLAVIDADRTRWSDWGTREAIERTFATLNQTPPWLMSHQHVAAGLATTR